MIEFTIEKDCLPDSWYDIYMLVNETKTKLGWGNVDYQDAVKEVENLVKEFSKIGINVIHNKIYHAEKSS